MTGVQINVSVVGCCCQAYHLLVLGHRGQTERYTVPLHCSTENTNLTSASAPLHNYSQGMHYMKELTEEQCSDKLPEESIGCGTNELYACVNVC